ncbi:hypothetical protein M422DRAFT_264102 [Sphaerobolus stellatus SS14]|uniref:Uncharacterized protein n=1 Tax=Sphaerobolus stellatus (strain SS14) TaxID=990650 RepID=A0A0C9UX02_SPHS4|nr:hypothetical protein M422DRAFT_264102 [Sphaerobolus stellatus SS14]
MAGIRPSLPDNVVEGHFNGTLGRKIYWEPILHRFHPLCSSQRSNVSLPCLWVGCAHEAVWVPLDEESGLHGKVITCSTRGDLFGVERGENDIEEVYRNFVKWLGTMWIVFSQRLRMIERRLMTRTKPLLQPTRNPTYDMFENFDIPAAPWHLKNTPYDTLLQEDLVSI